MSRPPTEILSSSSDVDVLSRDLVRQHCDGDWARVLRVGGAYLVANSRRHAERLLVDLQPVEEPPAPKRRRRKQVTA